MVRFCLRFSGFDFAKRRFQTKHPQLRCGPGTDRGILLGQSIFAFSSLKDCNHKISIIVEDLTHFKSKSWQRNAVFLPMTSFYRDLFSEL